jgi:hypothetical protein
VYCICLNVPVSPTVLTLPWGATHPGTDSCRGLRFEPQLLFFNPIRISRKLYPLATLPRFWRVARYLYWSTALWYQRTITSPDSGLSPRVGLHRGMISLIAGRLVITVESGRISLDSISVHHPNFKVLHHITTHNSYILSAQEWKPPTSCLLKSENHRHLVCSRVKTTDILSAQKWKPISTSMPCIQPLNPLPYLRIVEQWHVHIYDTTFQTNSQPLSWPDTPHAQHRDTTNTVVTF